MRKRLSYSAALLTLLLAAGISSCGVDGACACSPPGTVVGTYHATRFRITPSGQAPIDALAGGATISLTLSATGTTTGLLSVPAALNGGTAATYDLAGTYQLANARVTLSHAADTFLRDVHWTWTGNSLTTAETAGSVFYDVVLEY